jgi:uncharacterized protein (UPF0303 family)
MDQSQILQSLLAEEEELQLPSFDHAGALRLGFMLQERAGRDNLPIAIEVSKNGSPYFFCLMPGSSPDNLAWVQRKRAVVERFNHSSLYLKTLCDHQGRNMFERYAITPDRFAASGGAFPITVRETGIVGVAAVSGLTAADDHRIVTEALREIMQQGRAEAQKS